MEQAFLCELLGVPVHGSIIQHIQKWQQPEHGCWMANSINEDGSLLSDDGWIENAQSRHKTQTNG